MANEVGRHAKTRKDEEDDGVTEMCAVALTNERQSEKLLKHLTVKMCQRC